MLRLARYPARASVLGGLYRNNIYHPIRNTIYLNNLLHIQASAFTSTSPNKPADKKVPEKPETPIEQALREAKEQSVLDHLKGTQAPSTVVKKPLWDRVKEEAMHYWHGTKLLGAETKISARLCVKLLKGQKISRREVRQVYPTNFSCEERLVICSGWFLLSLSS
jgi:LETM1-like protein